MKIVYWKSFHLSPFSILRLHFLDFDVLSLCFFQSGISSHIMFFSLATLYSCWHNTVSFAYYFPSSFLQTFKILRKSELRQLPQTVPVVHCYTSMLSDTWKLHSQNSFLFFSWEIVVAVKETSLHTFFVLSYRITNKVRKVCTVIHAIACINITTKQNVIDIFLFYTIIHVSA